MSYHGELPGKPGKLPGSLWSLDCSCNPRVKEGERRGDSGKPKHLPDPALINVAVTAFGGNPEN